MDSTRFEKWWNDGGHALWQKTDSASGFLAALEMVFNAGGAVEAQEIRDARKRADARDPHP